jgi:hypothetical protein
MVPNTGVALALLVVAVLPGLVYVLSFERQASGYGVTLADRTLRLIVVSAVFHLLLGWPEYLVYRWTLAAGRRQLDTDQFVAIWCGLLLIVVLPFMAGSLIGKLYATRHSRTGFNWIRKRLSLESERRLLRLLLGRDPAPRAWDDYFSGRLTAYLRVRTTDGTALAGLFADRSYAAGFPHDPDLLLEEAWELGENGELVRPLGYPLYIAAGQIAWMDIVRPPEMTKE